MKGKRASRVVSLALAMLFATATASHEEAFGLSAPGIGSQQHDHGPFGACPEIKDHHCLACAAAHFAPAPAVSIVAPMQVRRAETKRTDATESRTPLLIRSGRSPPASSLAA